LTFPGAFVSQMHKGIKGLISTSNLHKSDGISIARAGAGRHGSVTMPEKWLPGNCLLPVPVIMVKN